MKILIINGQPKKNGLSRLLSEEYEKIKKAEGHEIKRINIYGLKFENFVDDVYYGNLEKDLVEAQKKISWAEHIVFFYPVWWVSFPSMMKSFLERILVPGFAFRYVEGKQKRLLEGKTAQVFATAGAKKWYVKTIGKIDQYRTLGKILLFCGIKLKRVKIFPSIGKKTNKERIEKIIKKLN